MEGIGRPVEEGKEYEVTIDARGAKGDGIAHVEGFVLEVAEDKISGSVERRIAVVSQEHLKCG